VESIGKRVKALRVSKRMTQEGLAVLVGCKQSSIAYIENDRTTEPKGETLNGLCKALDTTPDFILYGSDKKDHEHAMQEAELMAIWRRLTDQDRLQLLRAARGLVATTPPISAVVTRQTAQKKQLENAL
jgi:transcriptional regulator with XRE-family HTH domain